MDDISKTKQQAIDNLAKMNVAYTQGSLVVHCQDGDVTVVKLLLEAGINPNKIYVEKINKKDVSFLAINSAISKGHLEIVKLLVEYGADINYFDKTFAKPIDRAIELNNIELLSYLLEKGADINLQNEDGETAIYLAVKNKRLEMVKLLIDKGGDVNLKTKLKANALYLAQKNNNPEIVDLLKKAGAKEMTAEEIKAHKKKKVFATVPYVIALALCIGFVQLCNSHSSSSSGSSSSSTSAGSHTCTWCNKSYSGNGYNHLGGTGAQSYCAEATNGWEKQNQNCSMKCCEESWRSGKH